jgi:hypothetical protein
VLAADAEGRRRAGEAIAALVSAGR